MSLTKNERSEMIDQLRAMRAALEPASGDLLSEGIPYQVAQGFVDCIVAILGRNIIPPEGAK